MLLGQIIEPVCIDACLPDGSIKAVTFPTELIQDKEYLVVYFYPADFTSICPTEVLAFHAQLHEFAELNTAVVAVSCNTAYVHAAWKRTPKNEGGLGTSINHPILADPCRSLAERLDVLIPGRNLATRGLFVLNQSGEVLYESRHDTKTARSVSEVISLIRDLSEVLNTTGKRVRVDSI